MPIHPTAVVDPGAEIDASASIGPYAVIESGVTLGAECALAAHTWVGWGTTLGARVRMSPFAAVGGWPQDYAFEEQPSYVTVGDDTIIREGVTIHRGTKPESTTSVGARCMLMATSHVGHNCAVGDDVILVNSALLAGWVTVGDRALISGNGGAHQHCRVGKLALIHGTDAVLQDLLPFMVYQFASVIGVNIIGMRRGGYTPEERREAKEAHRVLFRSGRVWKDALDAFAAQAQTRVAEEILDFARGPSKRGFALYRPGRDQGAGVGAEGNA